MGKIQRKIQRNGRKKRETYDGKTPTRKVGIGEKVTRRTRKALGKSTFQFLSNFFSVFFNTLVLMSKNAKLNTM